MGRGIRKVPANWEHPKNDKGVYQPMFEGEYVIVVAEWIENHNLWLEGKHAGQLEGGNALKYKYFAQWDGNCPDVEFYNIYYTESEATWFQLYETVSEGTPVTPPFATEQKLIDYLVENGDFWYQSDSSGWRSKPTRAQAENIVRGGFAMSFVAIRTDSGAEILDAYQQQDIFTKKA